MRVHKLAERSLVVFPTYQKAWLSRFLHSTRANATSSGPNPSCIQGSSNAAQVSHASFAVGVVDRQGVTATEISLVFYIRGRQRLVSFEQVFPTEFQLPRF